MSIKKGLTSTAKTPDVVQVRDSFETPRYAVELLLPFIPKNVSIIWECASGSGRIQNVLERAGYEVYPSDIVPYKEDTNLFNFLTSPMPPFISDSSFDGQKAIITNPPFSVKREFIKKAFEYNVPFAFLINADYSGEQIEWIEMGCEKIIPKRRINYLTPNILQRIHDGEIYKIVSATFETDAILPLDEFKVQYAGAWETYLRLNIDVHNYKTIDDVPQELLNKYSSSQFHSMWLTYGFDIGKTETFVELPIPWIKERIV